MTRTLSLLFAVTFAMAIFSGCNGGAPPELTIDQQIEQIMSSSTDAAGKARKLMEIAKKQIDSNDRTGPPQTLKKVSEVCETITDPASQAKAFSELAEMQISIRKNSEARKSQNQAFEALAKVEEPGAKIAALMQVAKSQSVVKSPTGEIDNAKVNQLIKEAEGLLDQIGTADLKVKLICDLAATFSEMNRKDDVARLLALGQKAVDTADGERKRAEILGQLGVAFAANGQMDEAKELFTQGAQACEKLSDDNRSQGYALIELAERMLEAGFPKEAATVAAKGEEVANTIPDATMKYPLKKRAQAVIKSSGTTAQ